MDDCIILCRDKEYLKQCLAAMKCYVEEELLLKFNEKTQLATIKNGVDYLGFRFYLTDTGKVIRRLRTSSKRRWKWRLKKMERQYREDEITFEEISRSIASYKGHLKHGHTYRLKRKVFHDFVLTKEKKADEKKGEWNEKESEKQNKPMHLSASDSVDASGHTGDSCASGDGN